MISSLPIVALLLAGPAAGTGASSSERSVAAPAVDAVRLEVDHGALLDQQMPEAAEASARFVREDAVKALDERHGVAVVDDGGAPAVVVRLSWKDYENSIYRIEISARRGDGPPQSVAAFEANCINDTALADAVVAKLGAAIAQLEEPTPVPGEDDPGQADPAVVPPQEPKDRGSAPLSVMGKAGIGVLAGGVAGLVAGGIVLAQGRKLDNPSGGLIEPEGRDFRPPGIAVMVTGGVLAATGVALLIVDRVRARRSRRDAARVRVLPGGSSVVLTAKF